MNKRQERQIEYCQDDPIEKRRHRHRPKRITVLFVGESAPMSGKFFYDEQNQFFRTIKRAFGDADTFLADFKAKGYFLDDLVLEPVNHLTGAKRRKLHLDNVQSLAKRMREYQPLAVVSLLLAIKQPVTAAMEMAGLLPHIQHYPVPFPGNGHQKRFLEEMDRIIPRLP